MKQKVCAAFAAAVLGVSACGPTDATPDAGTSSDAGSLPQTITVTEDVTADITWRTGNTYLVNQTIFVKNATLTIEPGVTVKGGEGAALLVTTTGRLEAAGTAERPIVMTSNRDPGAREAGDWGGLVLLGNASLNTGTTQNHIEGIAPSDDTRYGGTDDAHDCGTVKYVRIEYAGYRFGDANEFNGLTLGACGRGTEIDFVQTHLGLDDGIEFFGGTADLKHAVITQPDDDALDWDMGWRGRVQFLIVQQNAAFGDKGFESDNNDPNLDATPRSAPEIWNATLIGAGATSPNTQRGMHLRRGTAGKFSNFVIAYFDDGILDVQHGATKSQAEAGALSLRNSILFGSNSSPSVVFPEESGAGNDEGFDEAAFFTASATENRTVDPALAAPLHLTSPSFKPSPGSPALNGGASPPSNGFFDATATHVGAIGGVDWTEGWTAYPEH